jgi:hypothetical protein
VILMLDLMCWCEFVMSAIMVHLRYVKIMFVALVINGPSRDVA